MSFVFDPIRTSVCGTFRIPAQYAGGKGIAHGGIVSLLLDEVCGKIMTGLSISGVTRNLNVDFLRPTPVEIEISLFAQLKEISRRKHFIEGSITDSSGNVLASCTALYIRLDTQPALS